jgi:hypothetical protein
MGGRRPDVQGRSVAGLIFAVVAIAGAVVVLAVGRDGGPGLSAPARRYPADARTAFVHQVRAADEAGELKAVKDVDLVNRGANFCTELARTGGSLKAVFALQVAKLTRPGDVYVTGAARRLLCPDLPDGDASR